MATPKPVRSTQINCQALVSPAQFLAMLVSRRRLVREDRRSRGLRGLKDVDTGELFEVEERKLFDVELCKEPSQLDHQRWAH